MRKEDYYLEATTTDRGWYFIFEDYDCRTGEFVPMSFRRRVHTALNHVLAKKEDYIGWPDDKKFSRPKEAIKAFLSLIISCFHSQIFLFNLIFAA